MAKKKAAPKDSADRKAVRDFALFHLKRLKLSPPEVSNALLDHVGDIVRRHAAACEKNGITVDNLDRIIIEAVEDYQLTQRHGQKTSVTYVDPNAQPTGPAMRYEQYRSPRDL